MLTKILIKLLKSKKTSSEDRALILNTLLERINALPIADIISYDLNGTLLVNGKSLSVDQAISLKESAVALQKNQFYRIIKEQIAFNAISIGIHKGNTLEQILFSKSALWIQQQEMELISKISGQNIENEV